MAIGTCVFRSEHMHVRNQLVAAKRAEEPVGLAELVAGGGVRCAVHGGGGGDGDSRDALGSNGRTEKARRWIGDCRSWGVADRGSFAGISCECSRVWSGVGGFVGDDRAILGDGQRSAGGKHGRTSDCADQLDWQSGERVRTLLDRVFTGSHAWISGGIVECGGDDGVGGGAGDGWKERKKV